MKTINPTPTEWRCDCPYCEQEHFIEEGLLQSNVGKETILKCDKCNKQFKVEVDITKI